MKLFLLPTSIVAILISFPVNAATFKCVVDGKTAYQETPCNDDVKSRGTQSTIAAPSRKADFGSGDVVSGAENKRRDTLVKSTLEPRAREAFTALKSGQAMTYRDMLCLRARQLLNHPAMKDSIKNAAAAYTKRNVEIDAITSSSNSNVTFSVVPDKTTGKSNTKRFIYVHFDWEDGKACVTHIEAP